MSQEYLVSFGTMGDFGRFLSQAPLRCRRGEAVVVHSPRGLELGTVLGDARPGMARFLPEASVGTLLRPATPEDWTQHRHRKTQAATVLASAQSRVHHLGLPLEVVDAEVLLDGATAVLQGLSKGLLDPRPLVSSLSREFDLRILLENLATASPPDDVSAQEEEHGCGRPGCGTEEGGGCGTSGGCTSCSAKSVDHLKAYFADLRSKRDHVLVPESR